MAVLNDVEYSAIEGPGGAGFDGWISLKLEEQIRYVYKRDYDRYV